MIPNAENYQYERRKHGSQAHVARLLGVSITTLSRRENGTQRVTPEMMLALQGLAEKPR